MKRSRVQKVSIPAPVNGLVLNRTGAQSDPLSAERLSNWFPTTRGARVRGGIEHVANASGAVVSMFVYSHPENAAMFAATEAKIHDVTGLNTSITAPAVLTGQTAGYYSTQQIGTAGGDYLYAVNGADAALLFDGVSWAAVDASSTPAITGIDTSLLSQVWLWKNRLFFVEKDTLNAHFLPVDSIGGAVTQVSMAGVFQRSGSLLFGATWSTDSGDGPDDYCVFVSTNGEFAVYQGSDPSDATTWALVGRYDISKPLGVNAVMSAGGDLAVATVEGIIPLSSAMQKDPAALSLAAVTRPIEPLWDVEASGAVTPWEIIKWPDRSLALITLPDAVSAKMFAVNLQTGAWGIADGWGATCGTIYNGQAYIGRPDGKIFACDESGADDGAPFVAQYCHAFTDLGFPAQYKRVQMIRGSFLSREDFAHVGSACSDQTIQFPSAPTSIHGNEDSEYLVWDEGDWDEKLWYSSNYPDPQVAAETYAESIYGAGWSVAVAWQVSSGGTEKLDVELLRSDLYFEVGGDVV